MRGFQTKRLTRTTLAEQGHRSLYQFFCLKTRSLFRLSHTSAQFFMIDLFWSNQYRRKWRFNDGFNNQFVSTHTKRGKNLCKSERCPCSARVVLVQRFVWNPRMQLSKERLTLYLRTHSHSGAFAMTANIVQTFASAPFKASRSWDETFLLLSCLIHVHDDAWCFVEVFEVPFQTSTQTSLFVFVGTFCACPVPSGLVFLRYLMYFP